MRGRGGDARRSKTRDETETKTNPTAMRRLSFGCQIADAARVKGWQTKLSQAHLVLLTDGKRRGIHPDSILRPGHALL